MGMNGISAKDAKQRIIFSNVWYNLTKIINHACKLMQYQYHDVNIPIGGKIKTKRLIGLMKFMFHNHVISQYIQ